MIMSEFGLHSKILYGPGTVSQLGAKAKEFGATKAFVACDRNLGEEAYAKVKGSLEAAGVDYVFFNETERDAPVTLVNKVGEMAKAAGVDCMIGVGGGSTMDLVKGATVLLSNPGPAEKYALPEPPSVPVNTPVILMPTTAGTGAEGTKCAIIAVEHNGYPMKWSLFIELAQTIIDPELTMTLPPYDTGCCGMDALAHAMEGVTSNNPNPLAHACGLNAIRLISRYLLRAYHDGNDREARIGMSKAAYLAGIAFDAPLTHIGHATADGLCTYLHTSHGEGCALAIPETIALVGSAVPDIMLEIAEAFELDYTKDMSGEELGQLAAAKCRAMMSEMGIPSLKQMGFSRDRMEQVSTETQNSHLTSFCPVQPITAEAALEFCYRVYDNYEGSDHPWLDRH